MKVLVVLSVMMAAALGMPTVQYYSTPYRPAHPVQTYTPPKTVAPAAVPAYSTYGTASQAYYSSRPFVTGTLYHSQDTLGQYNYGYSSSDGQSKSETKRADGTVTGTYKYTSPEGQNVQLDYTASREGGFNAAGTHIPQPPELPAEHAQAHYEALQRLEQAHAEARARGDIEIPDPRYDDGSYRGEHYYDSSSYVARPGVAYAAPSSVQTASYGTYSAAVPATYYGTAPAVAPAAPATSYGPVPYSSSSYQTNIGGPVASAPVVPTVTPAVPLVKNTYNYRGY